MDSKTFVATATGPHLTLPHFIPPMLSKPGQAFNSDLHLFEIKWDGMRCLCFVEDGGYRLMNRHQVDITERFPEFAAAASFPIGTVLDGELVVLQHGKPDFPLIQSRNQTRSQHKIRGLSRSLAATYIVFDFLYDRGVSLLERPLQERRQRLETLLKDNPIPNVVLSQGITGSGIELFRHTTAQSLEGVVAKRLNSRYLPGRRTDAWVKIKKGIELFCCIIGFEPSGTDDFGKLILAHEVNGELCSVGSVGTGFDASMRQRLNAFLWTHRRSKPVIKCGRKGFWVEPQLVCRVTCMELTRGGEMRTPVFHELVKE